MLIRCCNPECKAPFDYREGRLIRFSMVQATVKSLDGQPPVQHFWLCGTCAREFVFDANSGASLNIRPRNGGASAQILSGSASTAS
ncbi:MAG TPA: hypothetical protein VKV15_02665 [Bryobacteraceae bacterium]|nr:hypothetical protein [Bryobacteraceae bacterium]